MDTKRDILWRVYVSFLGIVLLSALILGKAFYIQRFEGAYWRGMSDSMHQRIVELDAERGTIYSEDGQMLSTSLPQFDIYLDFQAEGLRNKNGKVFRENVDSFAIAMSGQFKDKTAARYKQELRDGYRGKSRYYSLHKKMSFEEYKAFRNFPLVRLGRNKSGVIVEESSIRLSPFGLLANRTIGLSREHIASNGKVKKQNVGLEKTYDSLLTGQKGQRLMRSTSGGLIPVEGFLTEPENGCDLFTTIDVNIQDIAENALLRQLESTGSEYGTCLVMETKTGKLKAIANLGKRPGGGYWEDDNYALRVTEPGSTIKLVTLLAALEKGSARLTDPIEVGSEGRKQVGPRKNINDAERAPKPVMSVLECFAHSSNVGMAQVAYNAFRNDPEEFRTYLHKYHMDTRAAVDLSDVPKPRLASLKRNSGGVMNMITMAFGYSLQVSPLNTLTLYNAVANNGRMMKPYLVSSVRQNGILVREYQPTVLNEQIASEGTILAAKKSMEAVTSMGTAVAVVKGLPFQVAGKTGTAHVSDGRIEYNDGIYQASFVGYFPANDPQYTCIVVIRSKPHDPVHFGGSLAGPVFREVATKLFAMYVPASGPALFASKRDSSRFFYAGGSMDLRRIYTDLKVPYQDSSRAEWATVHGEAKEEQQGRHVMRGTRMAEKQMPDLQGMGLKDALFLLEQMGLKVTVTGRGKVTAQSLPAGSVIRKGLGIILNLS